MSRISIDDLIKWFDGIIHKKWVKLKAENFIKSY